MWRKLLRAAGCAGYLGLMAVLFAVVSYVTFGVFVRRGVTPTPELYGLAEEEARALLADQGLRLGWSEQEDRYDDEVPAGHLLIQRPRAGTLVKRGSTIDVILSRGPQRIAVPSLIGDAVQAAQVTLAAAGLGVGRVLSVYDGGAATGSVVAQQPPPGSLTERGGTVDLFLSLGSSGETYVMPDLVKRDYERVREFFESRGFRLGRVSYESYAGIRPGTVLRQFPQAGHPIHRGDVISLDVSPLPVPTDTAGPEAAPEGAGP